MYILHIICNLKKRYILTFYKNGRYKLIFFGEKYFMGLFFQAFFIFYHFLMFFRITYNMYILHILCIYYIYYVYIT